MKRDWTLVGIGAMFIAAFAFLFSWTMAGAQGTGGEGGLPPLDSLSTFALWSIVGGAISSVATALINQQHWQSKTKLAVFFVVCVLVAAGNAYFNRSLNLGDWTRSFILVVAAGWTTYIATKPAIKDVEASTTITDPQ